MKQWSAAFELIVLRVYTVDQGVVSLRTTCDVKQFICPLVLVQPYLDLMYSKNCDWDVEIRKRQR